MNLMFPDDDEWVSNPTEEDLENFRKILKQLAEAFHKEQKRLVLEGLLKKGPKKI